MYHDKVHTYLTQKREAVLVCCRTSPSSWVLEVEIESVEVFLSQERYARGKYKLTANFIVPNTFYLSTNGHHARVVYPNK